ncbi:hypothetical protein LINPERPRIM_LOCUS23954, partial [Linum perenne]
MMVEPMVILARSSVGVLDQKKKIKIVGIAAFTMNLGTCSITRAEMRGVVSGLQLAWERGYRKIQLQLDSKCVIHLLQAKGLEDLGRKISSSEIERCRFYTFIE